MTTIMIPCSAEYQNNLPDAIEKLRKAISISGNDSLLYTKLAGIYSEIGDYDNAYEVVDLLWKRTKEDEWVISAYIDLTGRIKPKNLPLWYEEAMKSKDKINYIRIVAARQQLYFLREAGFKVPNAALDILVPPTIVVFTGHSIDHPSFQVSLFPPDIEEDVKRIIKEKLESINAKIGYSSASCGADILFIEALQELGGEVNIVLPFAIQDFIENNVRHAGPRWEKRFEKALANAHSVSFSCEDRYLGHDMLYRFSNHVMHGSAVMRGKFLTTDPHLMAVWHSRTDSLPGGPADFIDRWSNISTLHLIDLDELYNENGTTDQIDTNLIKPQKTSLSFDPFVSKSPERVIKSMMFSD